MPIRSNTFAPGDSLFLRAVSFDVASVLLELTLLLFLAPTLEISDPDDSLLLFLAPTLEIPDPVDSLFLRAVSF